MEDALFSISPIDGRYRDKTSALRQIFSEFGLIKFRVKVEIEWLLNLTGNKNFPDIPTISNESRKSIEKIYETFEIKGATRIKEIEKETNHDVKAIEYYIKECLKQESKTYSDLSKILEFVHFTCTSEDINNVSYALMIKHARDTVLLPFIDKLLESIKERAHRYSNEPMLARTHGQPATPTTMGKEFGIFYYRLNQQREKISQVNVYAKMNGAVGNYNAHYIVYPEVNWPEFTSQLLNKLGLLINPYTTQVEPKDWMAELFQAIMRFNSILLDMNRDIWGYVALGYFNQQNVAGEVGSSTMPHKINPINFENSEGNIGIANALLDHFSQKLVVSRWQRDLSDSTVLRNIGVAYAHSILSYSETVRGLSRLQINSSKLVSELENSWEVLAEPIQTVMRRYAVEKSYEKLKDLTRGTKIEKEALHEFIKSLPIPENEKNRLLILTPQSYLGNAVDQANKV